MINRRTFLSGLGAVGVATILTQGAWAMGLFGEKKTTQDTKTFPFKLSDAEWKQRLSPEAYHVLRDHGTERAFTSPLNDEKRAGVFHCAGCDQALFNSADKFNSGTGWPSFTQPITPDAVGTSTDYKIGVGRTEVHCSNCGGHLGHVFEDGPAPTGLRYCMNGVVLRFQSAE
ncbi:peptide-methionine (R)-S-oxide reductase MsrB [Micavibrio aeruginosavorus]|uniref:peptide-methionine (R)-S-oxide reductase MsrB n=1 Tax=Micavibrio aeruginosavorus TaxID=349221 RepID=UPI003F4ABD32